MFDERRLLQANGKRVLRPTAVDAAEEGWRAGHGTAACD
jgi:hypothetical protein